MKPTDRRPPSEAFYKDFFSKNYIVMQYHLIQMLTENLADCSRVFESDLQSSLILGVLGQRALAARIRANFLEQGRAPPDVVPEEAVGMNSSSLAELSGIPRETVRRKLEGLAARGWVVRDPSGRWTVATDDNQAIARRDLAELDRRQIGRVARFLAATQRIVHATTQQERAEARSEAAQ